jgi:hypothetical protein
VNPTWHTLTPLQIRDWVRANVPRHGIVSAAAELEKLSDQFASIGLADPTSSILVTTEMSKLWDLKPPQGWTAPEIEMWKRLPYGTAAYISQKRAQDVREIRRLQNETAELRKNKDNGNHQAAADPTAPDT